MDAEAAVRVISRFSSATEGEIRRIALAGLAVHRHDPGAAFLRAATAGQERLRARALKAIGELGKTDLAGALVSHFSDTDDHCRCLAAWSAARLRTNLREAVEVLILIARAGGPDAVRALDMAVRCLPFAEARAWLDALGRTPETLRLAVIGTGVLGDPDSVDSLIALMSNPELARIAGDSFSLMTGADLGYEDLDADAPENSGEQPDDDAENEEVKPDPDGDLQWPAPDRIAQWWAKRRSQYRSGVRYLRGEPIGADSLARTIVQGTQRQRAAAALEIALLNPGRVLFEVRERGDRQLERVKRWTS
jgi:uncharacterized protein (TIGR02270 family)